MHWKFNQTVVLSLKHDSVIPKIIAFETSTGSYGKIS